MRAKLANLNHCAVPFLSRADANLYWFSASMGVLPVQCSFIKALLMSVSFLFKGLPLYIHYIITF